MSISEVASSSANTNVTQRNHWYVAYLPVLNDSVNNLLCCHGVPWVQ
jgi:hypothetical protein